VKDRFVIMSLLMMTLLILSGLSLFSPIVHAYNTEGCRWYNSTIGWEKDSSLTASDLQAVQLAIANWNDVPMSAHLQYNLRNDVVYYSVNQGNNGVLGVTTYRCLFGYFQGPTTVDLNDYYLNGFSVQHREYVTAHESGHAIGLAHTSGIDVMYPDDSVWYNYGIFVPMLDDINGVQSIYGSSSTTTANVCIYSVNYGHCSWGNNNGYPENIWISPPTTGAIAMVVPSGLPVSLPGSNTLLMITEVTPNTLYRFSMGIYLSGNPYDTSQRFMTIEVDSGGFKLVDSNPVTVVNIGTASPSTGTEYFVELVAQNGLSAYAYVFQKSNGNFIGSAGLSPNFGWSTSVWYGNGVWTDSSSSPASNYNVNAWYNYLKSYT
jgi:hypothetical protein